MTGKDVGYSIPSHHTIRILYTEMRDSVKDFVITAAKIFNMPEPIYEFGSYLVPGQIESANMRHFFPGKEYVGCDMREGPGVDRILNLHNIALEEHTVGTVLCLDTLEHVEHPYRAIEEIHRVLKPNGYFFASVLSIEDESYPRQEWREIAPCTFVDGDGKLFHFFAESELANELSWLETREIGKLQNIHPGCGRKSALFVIAARYPGPVKPEDVASKKTTLTQYERIRP